MRSTWRDYLEALLVAIIFATFARTYVAQAFKIPSGSMEQNLLIGDHILVNKFIHSKTAWQWEKRLTPSRRVRRGDVVVFKFPNEPTTDFIKRCIGVAGDIIEIRDKQLFVNGDPIDESSYVHHVDPRIYPSSVFLSDDYRLRDNFGPYEVPTGELFFLGDNRDFSNDSRFWGTVPTDLVKGRAVLIYWSFETEAEDIEWPGYLGRLRQLTDVLRGFPTRTRWERGLRLIR